MNHKNRVKKSLNHKNPDKVAVDFGSTAVTGMHVTCVAVTYFPTVLLRQPNKKAGAQLN